ncbi:MAG: hypothetical protein QOG07_1839, partial [Pseudonocardiales bacterium]|nr:hypothetical protein [Pseudonocardiales bacterium]
SIGTAVLNTVAITATRTYVSGHAGAAPVAGLVHGYATATASSAALLGVTAVVAAILIRTPRPQAHPPSASVSSS